MRNALAVLGIALLFSASAFGLAALPAAAGWRDDVLFHNLPFIVLGVAGVLGFVFAQSRVSLVALLLIAITYALDSAPGSKAASARVAVLLSSLYVPVLFALFHYLPERGLWTRHGWMRLLILLSAVVVIVLVPRLDTLAGFVADAEAWPFRDVHPWLRIPRAAALLFALSVPLFFFRAQQESPWLGPLMLAAATLALAALNCEADYWNPTRRDVVVLALMSGAGLMLMLAIMESSWRHANMDELTGLPARRPLRLHLQRLGERYAVAIADIDHFKQVNDKYGHDVGDQVLRYVAAVLRRGPAGRAYRQGGEEFAIIAENVEYSRFIEAMDELRVEVENRRFAIRGRDRPRRKPNTLRSGASSAARLSVTVSIGVARSGPRYASPEEVIAAADKALYRAKRGGRNRVCSTK